MQIHAEYKLKTTTARKCVPWLFHTFIIFQLSIRSSRDFAALAGEVEGRHTALLPLSGRIYLL